MTSHLIPIIAFERDTFLQALHPDLANEVRKWLAWYRTDPRGRPPFHTVGLIALCKQALASMFPMWPSAMDYYGFTEEDLQ